MLESVYSHARSAFDPSAYARNQKATSLTRVSVTHQPFKIFPGWLAGWLPACFLRSGKLKNSVPRTPVYPRSTACEWQTLNEKERDPFYPSGTNRGLFPHIPNRRRANALSNAREWEREQVSRRIRIIKCLLLRSFPDPRSTFHSSIPPSLLLWFFLLNHLTVNG
ncbi:hypothetical protein ALC60_06557 [Trachymyrmex zeteki]|uniref:Uncharacterized protein n=1 Tax=Mycetomoellerius zeteki TaxID=64791 RepID=A0A151X262_9HYME|nr:hypothetical protein ALC60_06557 [Trachymyrmex zeteki]